MSKYLRLAALTGVVFLLALAVSFGGKSEAASGKVLDKIFYGDTWTWPMEAGTLKHFKKGMFFVPVQDDGAIAIIDPEKPGFGIKLVKTDYVQPHHPWIAPGMRHVWINFQSERKGDHDAIGVLDSQTHKFVKYIKTGINDPFHGAFSPTDNLLISGDLDLKAGHVHLMDTNTLKLVASIKTTGKRTRDITITHDGRYAFIGHQGYDPKKGLMGSVDVLDIRKRKIVASLGDGRCRSGKMSNNGKVVFYSCDRKDYIIAIDTKTLKVLGKIKVPKKSRPFNITFRGDDKYAYVGLLRIGKLGVIDVDQLKMIKTLKSGKRTNSTYIHPYAPLAVVTNDGTENTVSVLDVNKNEILYTIETDGKGTHNAAWSPDGRFMVVSNRLADSATVLRYDPSDGKIKRVGKAKIGFGANGVQWAPYFSGVKVLTKTNYKSAKQ